MQAYEKVLKPIFKLEKNSTGLYIVLITFTNSDIKMYVCLNKDNTVDNAAMTINGTVYDIGELSINSPILHNITNDDILLVLAFASNIVKIDNDVLFRHKIQVSINVEYGKLGDADLDECRMGSTWSGTSMSYEGATITYHHKDNFENNTSLSITDFGYPIPILDTRYNLQVDRNLLNQLLEDQGFSNMVIIASIFFKDMTRILAQ